MRGGFPLITTVIGRDMSFGLGRTLGSLHGATEQDISMENGRITTGEVAAASGDIVRGNLKRPISHFGTGFKRCVRRLFW